LARAHLPEDQKNALGRGARVVFEDEVYFQQEGTTRRSWSRRGKGFIVYHHPCKRGAKFFGAISVSRRPALAFRPARKFNSRTFERFLVDVLRRYRKVALIIDNAPYHKAKRLRPFLRANRHRLWIYSLPKYSPELNAQEQVWRETRKDATHNRYFGTLKGLNRTVRTQFRTYQAQPHLLLGTVARFL